MLSSLTYPGYSETAFRRLLDTHGYVYLNEIPDGFDHTDFCRRYGELMPQYDGKLHYLIRAEEEFQHLNHSLTTNPLQPHTDGYEFTGAPPRHLALWCLFPPSDGGGRTTLCDLYPFLDTLDEEDRRTLAERRYRFLSGIEDTSVERSALHPVLDEGDAARPTVRFSPDFVEGDAFLTDVTGRLLDYFQRHHVEIAYETNALLFWDNLRMVHGRTGYEDRRRQLRRVWLR
ncbi:TauD/TfdA dioxygenase family protein [Streptomyces daliensis]|uniref:TauD/TfdA family dioxygenase n=1 Tax=Streptomyces daliensis TaxID=299421 RepID=A0A8T4J0J6_9ACTN|nr:TauD/TfdA family dioxygenase [Streptomyces daliensis]